MTAGRQVRYLFTSTDGREIELRGFIVRDTLFSSLAPAKLNAAFKAASVLDTIPLPAVDGKETSETDLIAYALLYGFTLTKTDSDDVKTTLSTALAAAATLAVAADGAGLKNNLSWVGAGIYDVYRSRGSDANFQKITTTSSVTTYADAAVLEGETYYYKIRLANNATGNHGAFSNVVNIVAVDNS